MTVSRKNLFVHTPVIILLAVVFGIFLFAIFTFEITETEVVVVERWGAPQTKRSNEPGLHMRWPYPIEEIWRHDNRIHVFTGSRGEIEEVLTSDKRNIIVTVYLTWRIYNDPKDLQGSVIRYRERVTDKDAAENNLTSLMREARRNVFGKHAFRELINEDPEQIKIDAIEAEMLKQISTRAKDDFAIEVLHVGVAHIGLPAQAAAKVFERMRAERKIESDRIIAEGQSDAKRIRAEATRKKEEILSIANREAIEIRALGDKAANESYQKFRRNPELAVFLQQLQALRKVLDKKTYLILDTTTPPINLMSEKTLQKLLQGHVQVELVDDQDAAEDQEEVDQ